MVRKATPLKKEKAPAKAAGKKKMKRKYKILLWILGILIIARIALPYVVLHYANKKLAHMKGYYGHIEDIDISLYRGAYTIKQLDLRKLDKKDTVEFLYMKETDLAIEWKPILHGELVGKVLIDSTSLIFTKEKNDLSDVAKDTADFREVLNSFMPLTLNRVEVKNSVVRYKDPSSKPKLDMLVNNIHVVALNLVNGYDSTAVLPATVDASANLYKGDVSLHVKLDPFAKQSTFDMNASIKHINLVSLNDFLRAYAKFDVNKGSFEMYTEFAAKDGKVDGYVKPLIKDLDVLTWDKEEGDFGRKVYEGVIGAAAWIFKNHKKDQLGSKIYVHGPMKDPHIKVGKAVLTLLQNAFIMALKPYIDESVNLKSINKDDGKSTFIDNIIEKRKDKKEARKVKRSARREKRKKK